MKRLAHSLVVAAVAAVGLSILAPSAGACVLAGPPPTPDQRVQAADVVFTGTVTAGEPQLDGGSLMTVKVDRVIKGTVPAEVQLISGRTSCSESYAVGARVGLAMRPTTPMPWGSGTPDVVSWAALDALPLDAAFAPLAIRAVAVRARRAEVQVHLRARACTTLRPRVVETARSLKISVRAADGPPCATGARRDRCVMLTAKGLVGARGVSPRKARRVAWLPAARCPQVASS